MAKNNFGVKYLLAQQDLFDRTVYAKGMKTKDSKETVSKLFPKTIDQKKKGRSVDRICWKIENFSSTEGMEIYSTMSETKSAFAERTMSSIENIVYRSKTWRIMGTSTFIKYIIF